MHAQNVANTLHDAKDANDIFNCILNQQKNHTNVHCAMIKHSRGPYYCPNTILKHMECTKVFRPIDWLKLHDKFVYFIIQCIIALKSEE